MKIVINRCFGGFGLSPEAAVVLGCDSHGYYPPDSVIDQIGRRDAQLVTLMETWGTEKVSGAFADLKVVEIPDDIEWEIQEYDGREWVAEKHRTWR